MTDEPEFDFTRSLRGDQIERLRNGTPGPTDISAFRTMLRLPTIEFAQVMGVDAQSLSSWEAGTSSPDRTQRILMSAIARHPGLVLRHELPVTI
jgi:DNA-binding transcriptional regulator YiaG